MRRTHVLSKIGCSLAYLRYSCNNRFRLRLAHLTPLSDASAVPLARTARMEAFCLTPAPDDSGDDLCTRLQFTTSAARDICEASAGSRACCKLRPAALYETFGGLDPRLRYIVRRDGHPPSRSENAAAAVNFTAPGTRYRLQSTRCLRRSTAPRPSSSAHPNDPRARRV